MILVYMYWYAMLIWAIALPISYRTLSALQGRAPVEFKGPLPSTKHAVGPTHTATSNGAFPGQQLRSQQNLAGLFSLNMLVPWQWSADLMQCTAIKLKKLLQLPS